MEKLVVTAEKLKVHGRYLRRGTEFEATEKQAKLFKALGAAPAGEAKKSRADLPKEVMKRAPKKEAAEEPAPLAPTYQRRDMQAAGLTGEETPAPSSHRGRRPRSRISGSSKGDAE